MVNLIRHMVNHIKSPTHMGGTMIDDGEGHDV